ncbi:MAG: hypothetical protein SFV21_21715 [Rhodospirillaceae bacterium]|nr:hypothetical protein [Rhodospirillaceae bacterium]
MAMTRRNLCAAALMAPLLAACARDRVVVDKAAPPLGIDLDWRDTARDRPVPARLHWPLDPAPRVPLMVFSHGMGGSRRGYSWFGQHLARQGWASLHVQHVGSDRALWSGNPFGVIDRLQAAAQEAEARHRAHDLRFALDQMLGGLRLPDDAIIDPTRIVAAGHSYGASTSLLLAGASVLRQGERVDLRDPRFTAAIVMSAPPFYRESDPASILAPVRIPTLHVSTTEDVIRIPGYRSEPPDRIAVFDAIRDPRKLLVMYAGGSHSIFTDRSGDCGHAHEIKSATKNLALAWLRQVYAGDVTSLADWKAQWRPLIHRYQPALSPTMESA